MSDKTISQDECRILNDILDTKSPSGCFHMTRNDMEDNFTMTDSQNRFQGKDETHHRNSWLMPRMARRMTKNNKYHVSNWRQDPAIDSSECAKLRSLLLEKLDSVDEVNLNLPKACQN